MRQIVLDTETTGLEVQQGHRIIEIGGVEVVDRRLTGRHFHKYVNPEREIDDAALEVHGISEAFLKDKPRFREIAEEFLGFVKGAELVIHNAPFDTGFLNRELELIGAAAPIEELCRVTDSLALAKHKHPGQKNSLDALCRRYEVDNSARELHGALLDAEILADVYLLMTGGQTALFAAREGAGDGGAAAANRRLTEVPELRLVTASDRELEAHEAMLDKLDKASDGAVWRRLSTGA